MPGTPSWSWITIDDFSPGIHGDYHSGITGTTRGSAYLQNGAAVIRSTYRCCSDQVGALVPLPE